MLAQIPQRRIALHTYLLGPLGGADEHAWQGALKQLPNERHRD